MDSSSSDSEESPNKLRQSPATNDSIYENSDSDYSASGAESVEVRLTRSSSKRRKRMSIPQKKAKKRKPIVEDDSDTDYSDSNTQLELTSTFVEGTQPEEDIQGSESEAYLPHSLNREEQLDTSSNESGDEELPATQTQHLSQISGIFDAPTQPMDQEEEYESDEEVTLTLPQASSTFVENHSSSESEIDEPSSRTRRSLRKSTQLSQSTNLREAPSGSSPFEDTENENASKKKRKRKSRSHSLDKGSSDNSETGNQTTVTKTTPKKRRRSKGIKKDANQDRDVDDRKEQQDSSDTGSLSDGSKKSSASSTLSNASRSSKSKKQSTNRKREKGSNSEAQKGSVAESQTRTRLSRKATAKSDKGTQAAKPKRTRKGRSRSTPPSAASDTEEQENTTTSRNSKAMSTENKTVPNDNSVSHETSGNESSLESAGAHPNQRSEEVSDKDASSNEEENSSSSDDEYDIDPSRAPRLGLYGRVSVGARAKANAHFKATKKRKTGETLIGTKVVKKKFGMVTGFRGIVVSYDSKRKMYCVEFGPNDVEEMKRSGFAAVTPKPYVKRKRPKKPKKEKPPKKAANSISTRALSLLEKTTSKITRNGLLRLAGVKVEEGVSKKLLMQLQESDEGLRIAAGALAKALACKRDAENLEKRDVQLGIEYQPLHDETLFRYIFEQWYVDYKKEYTEEVEKLSEKYPKHWRDMIDDCLTSTDFFNLEWKNMTLPERNAFTEILKVEREAHNKIRDEIRKEAGEFELDETFEYSKEDRARISRAGRVAFRSSKMRSIQVLRQGIANDLKYQKLEREYQDLVAKLKVIEAKVEDKKSSMNDVKVSLPELEAMESEYRTVDLATLTFRKNFLDENSEEI